MPETSSMSDPTRTYVAACTYVVQQTGSTYIFLDSTLKVLAAFDDGVGSDTSGRDSYIDPIVTIFVWW